MANKTLVYEHYITLVELTKQQLLLLEESRHDQLLDDIELLEQRKEGIKAKIDEAINRESGFNLDEEMSSRLVGYINEIYELTQTLKEKIQNWYDDDSRELKSLSNQRKTIKAYGGLYNSDIVSLFFDEKK